MFRHHLLIIFLLHFFSGSNKHIYTQGMCIWKRKNEKLDKLTVLVVVVVVVNQLYSNFFFLIWFHSFIHSFGYQNVTSVCVCVCEFDFTKDFSFFARSLRNDEEM